MEDIRFKQGLLTIVNLFLILKAPVSYDLSTITKENPKANTIEFATLCKDIANHFSRTFFNEFKMDYPYVPNKKWNKKGRFIDLPFTKSDNPVFATPKAGANGPSAIGATSVLDCMASYDSGIYRTQFEIARKVFTPKAFTT